MDDTMRITQAGFLNRIIERHNNRPDSPFCFVLGAGASKSSGIPTGQELAKKWISGAQSRAALSALPYSIHSSNHHG